MMPCGLFGQRALFGMVTAEEKSSEGCPIQDCPRRRWREERVCLSFYLSLCSRFGFCKAIKFDLHDHCEQESMVYTMMPLWSSQSLFCNLFYKDSIRAGGKCVIKHHLVQCANCYLILDKFLLATNVNQNKEHSNLFVAPNGPIRYNSMRS